MLAFSLLGMMSTACLSAGNASPWIAAAIGVDVNEFEGFPPRHPRQWRVNRVRALTPVKKGVTIGLIANSLQKVMLCMPAAMHRAAAQWQCCASTKTKWRGRCRASTKNGAVEAAQAKKNGAVEAAPLLLHGLCLIRACR
ncbi:hypothetical protein [Dyella acidiphila]|uniref:Uncharacterized protein n=1 Tax=Dyella acidiphila TaxID=2775866 RepID=A0ABR9G897_9GAMM|nr:hypothetical protein [Dyella acidiphila]MBE1160278.1 hypothetical protein [Dyella acidiphila]